MQPRLRAYRPLIYAMLLLAAVLPRTAFAQTEFEVASVRPSSGEVKFERNGITKIDHGTLTMHDVTVSTCIQFAYSTSRGLISGPALLKDVHYDIIAKADPATTQAQMRIMMRALLADRFKLKFHPEKKELRVFTLVVAKTGIKMHPSAPGGEMSHQNSATGMVAHSITMHEFADYISDPLESPVTDSTNLPGRYDFTIDFTPYVDQTQNDIRPDATSVMTATLRGDLGLDLIRAKQVVDIMVVDHVEPPTGN